MTTALAAKQPTPQDGLRVLVIGTSGSGKSTFASRLAQATKLEYFDLDVMNWRPGWYGRSTEEPSLFLADVEEAVARPNWVLAGNYAITRPITLPRLTHLVWLDLPLGRVMRQVIMRSIQRASSGKDVFPGCRETWGRMLDPEHPIRWALSTHKSRRPRHQAMAEQIAASGGTILRCTDHASVTAAHHLLVGEARVRSAA